MAEACAERPWKIASTSAMAMQGIVTRFSLEGWIIIAASVPSNAPSRAMISLPPKRSSAGVPR